MDRKWLHSTGGRKSSGSVTLCWSWSGPGSGEMGHSLEPGPVRSVYDACGSSLLVSCFARKGPLFELEQAQYPSY